MVSQLLEASVAGCLLLIVVMTTWQGSESADFPPMTPLVPRVIQPVVDGWSMILVERLTHIYPGTVNQPDPFGNLTRGRFDWTFLGDLNSTATANPSGIFDHLLTSGMLTLAGGAVAAVMLDFLLLQAFTSRGGVERHLLVMSLWILLAVAYAGLVHHRRGTDAVQSWWTGYVLEWMLSFDNLFLFHAVFHMYRTPRDMQHRALFGGILGAALFRMIFFVGMVYLLRWIRIFRYVCGCGLIFSAIQAVISESDVEPTTLADLQLVHFLKTLLGDRLMPSYEAGRFFVSEDGKLRVTLLVPVLVSLEIVDIIFAADSVIAKVSQVPDMWLNWSSTLLAMFGLRSAFFIVEDLIEMFELLKYGVGLILLFVGVQTIFSDFFVLKPWVTLSVMVITFLICIVLSVFRWFFKPSKFTGPAETSTPSSKIRRLSSR